MSIKDSSVIDYITISRTKSIANFIIVDDLDWDQNEEDDKEHMWLLQEKINAYIAAIESGDLEEGYPGITDMRKTICIYTKYQTSVKFQEYIPYIQSVLATLDVSLEVELV